MRSRIRHTMLALAAALPLLIGLGTQNLGAMPPPTAEMVIVADVDLALLDQARARGSVLNHQDAAQDGLHVRFDGTIQVHRLPWSETSGPGPASQA